MGRTAICHGFERPGGAAPLPSLTADTGAFDLHAPVALVNDGYGWHSLSAPARGCPPVPVPRAGAWPSQTVARHGAPARHHAFLKRGDDADVRAELVRCFGLSPGDAFHLAVSRSQHGCAAYAPV